MTVRPTQGHLGNHRAVAHRHGQLVAVDRRKRRVTVLGTSLRLGERWAW
jgi:hypothetical protein